MLDQGEYTIDQLEARQLFWAKRLRRKYAGVHRSFFEIRFGFNLRHRHRVLGRDVAAMPCSKYVVERQELHDKPLPYDCVDVSPAGATMLTVAVAQSATSAEVTLTFATSLSVRIAFVRDQVSH